MSPYEKYKQTIAQPEYAEWQQWISKQNDFANDPIRPFMRCACRKKLLLVDAYKCLYCKEWFCEKCAEAHFGKTVEQYFNEKEQNA